MDNEAGLPKAERVQELTGSPTVSIMDKARRLIAAGEPVVNLSGGDPDFDTPAHVTEAGIAALKDGFTHYTPSRGIPELLQAIADKTEVENNARYDPQNEIIVFPGAKLGLFTAAQAVLNPGDEVLLFDPCWVSYAPCVVLAGAKPVYIPMDFNTSLDELTDRLRNAVTLHTRMLIVNTPNNPTGQMWTQAQLEIVAALAQEKNLLVLSDEIYEKLAFEGRKHFSIAGLPGMNSRTLIVNGLSKSHAMTGWRLGWVAGPQAVTAQMLKIHQHSATCAPSFVQAAAVAALQGPQEYIQEMVGRYQIRRDALVRTLNRIPGVRCELPQGAFYAFPDVSGTGLSGLEFTDQLLESERVAVTPGIAFGPASGGHVRLSFANSDELLNEAAARIARFVTKIQ